MEAGGQEPVTDYTTLLRISRIRGSILCWRYLALEPIDSQPLLWQLETVTVSTARWAYKSIANQNMAMRSSNQGMRTAHSSCGYQWLQSSPKREFRPTELGSWVYQDI